MKSSHVFLSCIFICFVKGYSIPLIQQVTNPIDHGECPFWDNITQSLYYVNMFEGEILRYNYTSKTVDRISLNGPAAPVIPHKTKRGILVVGINKTVTLGKWTGDKWITTREIRIDPKDEFSSRLNEGKADKRGRLWIGTMGIQRADGTVPFKQGALYRITPLSVRKVVKRVNISNGMAWNRANNKFYYIDTLTNKITGYDYNDRLGVISDPYTVFDLLENGIIGLPDGMTIDKDDNLWIAVVTGSSVIKVNPSTGKLLQRIEIPARDVTSVAWGGPQFDILYVTTSRRQLTEEQRLEQPVAGSVFAITNTGSSGYPDNYVDI